MRRLELLSVVIFRCSSLLVTWQRPCSLWSMKCNLSSKSIRDANYSSTFFSYSSLYSRVPREWRAPPPILVHTICDVNYTSSYNSSTRWRWGKLSQWTRNHGQLFFFEFIFMRRPFGCMYCGTFVVRDVSDVLFARTRALSLSFAPHFPLLERKGWDFLYWFSFAPWLRLLLLKPPHARTKHI